MKNYEKQKHHIDLFSGIGGFAYAIDNVYGRENIKHVFVENDDFCVEVLKKHWSEAEYHGDIMEFVANAKRARKLQPQGSKQKKREWFGDIHILTGGFPCQPFSTAGLRKGTADDRYLWPPMLKAISILRPDWVIAENVEGLLTWNNGLVFEQVCSDLESEGYEVQPFIIPAVSVNAPHRRDRVWIVGHATGGGDTEEREVSQGKATESNRGDSDAPDTKRAGHQRKVNQERPSARHNRRTQQPDWSANWIEVATRLCRMDDGVPRRLDRNLRLKALGNAIVPQVAEEIIKAIKVVDNSL